MYYKVRLSLSQKGANIKKWGNVITKKGRYYKIGQLFQSRVVHVSIQFGMCSCKHGSP